MSLILLMAAMMAVGAILGAGLVLWLSGRRPPDRTADMARCGPVFLFHDNQLIDTTIDAQQMIAPFSHLPDRDAVLAALSPQFPALADHLQSGNRLSCRIAHATDDTIRIDLDWPNGHPRLVVMDPGRAIQSAAGDQPFAELSMLRDILDSAPQLIWRTDENGAVIWANRAYQDVWNRLHPHDTAGLPQKTIFPAFASKITRGSVSVRRLAIPLPQKDAAQWFDVSSMQKDTTTLHYAADANAAVSADQERHNFVQVLGKTFAELSIGLAIFDKRRQLATFNPALLDMTRLGFEFLSSRPMIDTVLDRLRETRMLPEPKNYASWRDRFIAVETAARNGTYSEVWDLPDGQAFRVTGRPHPDGGFVFLFEDITADLSLTRRFRSDIETGQAVLDALPDAVAVFSTAGTLVMYNRAYGTLWGMQAAQGIALRVIGSEMAIWQSRCASPVDWTELQQLIHQLGPRQDWTDETMLQDGRLVRCSASPVAGGMTMVRFAPLARNMRALRKLTQPDPAIRAIGR